VVHKISLPTMVGWLGGGGGNVSSVVRITNNIKVECTLQTVPTLIRPGRFYPLSNVGGGGRGLIFNKKGR
jgi:hypothetical protein